MGLFVVKAHGLDSDDLNSGPSNSIVGLVGKRELRFMKYFEVSTFVFNPHQNHWATKSVSLSPNEYLITQTK